MKLYTKSMPLRVYDEEGVLMLWESTYSGPRALVVGQDYTYGNIWLGGPKIGVVIL